MNLKAWQYEALNFPYSDEGIVEKLYIEFFAAAGRKVRADLGKKRAPYGKRPANPILLDRDKEFIALYKDGKTLEDIGKLYGITRERVRQRLAKHGITKDEGGSTIKQFKMIPDRLLKRKEAQEKLEQKHFAKWGCSREFIDSISNLPRSHSKHPLRLYGSQQSNANTRGVGWNISFPDWWKIWQDSGKWELRGRGKGYCMARLGDSGPYEVGNVEIITIGQNFSDSYITNPWKDRFHNNKKKRTRQVRFTFVPKTERWQVNLGATFIGCFANRPLKKRVSGTNQWK